MIVDRIRELCEKRGTNFSAVEKALGLANASLKKTNEKTQASRLKAIADYFGVSVESHSLRQMKKPSKYGIC